MAMEITCICDRCGAVITELTDISASAEGTPVHLCGRCLDELNSLIAHHFLKHEDGMFTMMDAPYADIARIETELEEAMREIEELEEELERLRDVKDELFETNFVLTAKLKELGVEVED